MLLACERETLLRPVLLVSQQKPDVQVVNDSIVSGSPPPPPPDTQRSVSGGRLRVLLWRCTAAEASGRRHSYVHRCDRETTDTTRSRGPDPLLRAVSTYRCFHQIHEAAQTCDAAVAALTANPSRVRGPTNDSRENRLYKKEDEKII